MTSEIFQFFSECFNTHSVFYVQHISIASGGTSVILAAALDRDHHVNRAALAKVLLDMASFSPPPLIGRLHAGMQRSSGCTWANYRGY